MEEIGVGRGTLIEISRRKRLHQSGVPLLDLTGREKRSRIALWWTYEADFLPGRAGLAAIIRRVPQFAALSQLKATNPASLGGTFGGTYCLLILKILKINILLLDVSPSLPTKSFVLLYIQEKYKRLALENL
jgi:hypothetical protein